ncbi:MAG: hypothetical protein ABW159_18085 [Candidatus Thiodiazotropha sp.]
MAQERKGGVKSRTGGKGTSPKEGIELKEMGSAGRVVGGGSSSEAGVKETPFSVTKKSSIGLKSFGPKYDVYDELVKHDLRLQMESIAPGTKFTPAPIEEFKSGMKAKASKALSVKPTENVSPRYPTVESINSGSALKDAYRVARPIRQIEAVLNGDAFSASPPFLTSDKVHSVPSLGGKSIKPEELFKNIKGGIDTVDTLNKEVAIIRTGSTRVEPGSSADLDQLKRLNKRLNEAEKNTKKMFKNAGKAASKHIDEVFRYNRAEAHENIKTSRNLIKGLRNELREDLKWIQKEPVASEETELKRVGGGGESKRANRDKYRPQRESDRAIKFDQRWRDGRAEIERAEQDLSSEVRRIKEMRKGRDLLKKTVREEVKNALKGTKAFIKNAKQRAGVYRAGWRARLGRFMLR